MTRDCPQWLSQWWLPPVCCREALSKIADLSGASACLGKEKEPSPEACPAVACLHVCWCLGCPSLTSLVLNLACN